MRKQFPGYYQPTKAAFAKMWQESVFAFDANVLLDLFRYSDETARLMLSTLAKITDRIWLPHQAALEYHRRLHTVIEREANSYDKARRLADELLQMLVSQRGHPFPDPKLLKKIKSSFTRLRGELDSKKEAMLSLLTSNPVKDKLADFFEGKVGQAFSTEELERLYQEADKRYLARIPPGYSDAKDKEGNEKYGDYVLWKQILNKAKEIDTGIIFVTGDSKKDWILTTEQGRKLSPRPELIAELTAVKAIPFYVYGTDMFLQLAGRHLDLTIKKEALEEVRSFGRLRRLLDESPPLQPTSGFAALHLSPASLFSSGLVEGAPQTAPGSPGLLAGLVDAARASSVSSSNLLRAIDEVTHTSPGSFGILRALDQTAPRVNLRSEGPDTESEDAK